MKIKNALLIGLALNALYLSGCTSTENNEFTNDLPLTDKQHARVNEQVTVYKARAELPRNTVIIGKVSSQNTNPDGTKASKERILLELKRQAVKAGGNGIVRITPGIAQTTADAVHVQ